jgi:hypothetical protein
MNTKLASLTGLGLAAAIAAAALAVMVARAGTAQAQAGGAVSTPSMTVAPGATFEVDVVATAPTGNLGAWDVTVAYDTAVLDVTSTDPGASLDCADNNGTLQMAGTAPTLAGFSGDTVICTITFEAVGADGDTSALTVTVTSFGDADANDVTPTVSSGTITLAEPTPSPSPAPGTATATASPAAPPPTGGAVGDDGSSTMTWALVAAGLAIVAGGAWAVARARREI